MSNLVDKYMERQNMESLPCARCPAGTDSEGKRACKMVCFTLGEFLNLPLPFLYFYDNIFLASYLNMPVLE